MKRKHTPIWKKKGQRRSMLQMLCNLVTDKNKPLIQQKGNLKVVVPVYLQDLHFHRGCTLLLGLLWVIKLVSRFNIKCNSKRTR